MLKIGIAHLFLSLSYYLLASIFVKRLLYTSVAAELCYNLFWFLGDIFQLLIGMALDLKGRVSDTQQDQLATFKNN